MAKDVEKAARDSSSTFDDSVSLANILPASAHTLQSDDVVKLLHTDDRLGLHVNTVASLQEKFGPNRLKPPPKPSLLKIIGRQVLNAMTLVLLGSMAVSFGTRDWISGGVIFALVLMNIVTGTLTQWKAEKTIAALESVGSPVATVIRHRDARRKEPKVETIPTEEVVPGDIIQIKIGDIIPADARILDGHIADLECDEALLTGESLPVAKSAKVISNSDCPVGDRLNLVFSGSQVTKGRALAVVYGVGMGTELGKIAAALEKKETVNLKGWRYRWYQTKSVLGLADTTPLQIKLNQLAYVLLGLAIICAIIVLASTAFQDVPLSIATYAVATAVSLLPASLIAVLSLTLAIASTDLAKRNALVRRMDAIEALSAVSDVCSDKTGTITLGRMVLQKAWVPTVDAGSPDRPSGRSRVDTKTGQLYSVETSSDPYYPRGAVLAIPPDSSIDEEVSPDEDDAEILDYAVRINEQEGRFKDLTLCASLCNVATLTKKPDSKLWEAHGDPTEIALQVFAHKLGLGKPHLMHPHTRNTAKQDHLPIVQDTNDRLSPPPLGGALQSTTSVQSGASVDRPAKASTRGRYELIVEHPFDSTIKRMSTAWRIYPHDSTSGEPKVSMFMKGAVERLFERSTHIGLDLAVELTEEHKATIIDRMDSLAAEGLRVLTLCGKTMSIDEVDKVRDMPRDEFEQGFGFLGLVGIYDPPREESRGAVVECQRAGVVPRMLTGDHKATATAIAKMVNILDGTEGKYAVMTGQQFDALTEDEIDALPELPKVIARCAPETKVRMVEALHRRKRRTIMTGDGVNDSPALKRSDVGVAMGFNGSDVAKQSADIVLADDNFSTIVRALRKGRSVFNNLSKFLLYLLSGNLSEVIVLLIGLSFKEVSGISVFPLSPVAALWINTLAAGPPAFALGVEPTAPDTMDRPPTDFLSIFTVEWYLDLIFYGITMGGLSLMNFVIVIYGYNNGELGTDCNENDNETCHAVFRARAACFATQVITIMIHALTCKHRTMTIFQMRLMNNKLLLACVVILSFMVFPIVYIPVINNDVFLLRGIGWEWGIVFGAVVVYMLLAELWKFGRRMHERRRSPKQNIYRDKSLGLAATIEPSTW